MRVCESEIRAGSLKHLKDQNIDMSRHASRRATRAFTSPPYTLGVPDNQQPQTRHQGQVQRDVNVFHGSQQKRE